MTTWVKLTRRGFLSVLGALIILPQVRAARGSSKFVWQPGDLQLVTTAAKPGGITVPAVSRRTVPADEFAIAGFCYYDGPRVHAGLLPGLPLRLRAEPTNPHDPLAVEIFLGDTKLGYVPRTHNAALSHLLRARLPVHCRICRVNAPVPAWDAVHVQVLFRYPADGPAPDPAAEGALSRAPRP